MSWALSYQKQLNGEISDQVSLDAGVIELVGQSTRDLCWKSRGAVQRFQLFGWIPDNDKR